jgi:hypothetical protein
MTRAVLGQVGEWVRAHREQVDRFLRGISGAAGVLLALGGAL